MSYWWIRQCSNKQTNKQKNAKCTSYAGEAHSCATVLKQPTTRRALSRRYAPAVEIVERSYDPLTKNSSAANNYVSVATPGAAKAALSRACSSLQHKGIVACATHLSNAACVWRRSPASMRQVRNQSLPLLGTGCASGPDAGCSAALDSTVMRDAVSSCA